MDATNAPFHSLDALSEGWAKTKSNLTPLLVLGTIAAFLGLLQQSLSRPGHEGVGNLLGLVIQVLQAALMMVYIRSALTLAGGRPLELTLRAELLTNFFGYLLTSILYGVIVVAGLVLLIVPGVVWALKFGFATFLVVDEGLDPLAALRKSSQLTRGAKPQLLQFGLLVLGVNLLGAMALGLGLLVTMPTTLIATAHVLRKLQARAGSPLQSARPAGASPGEGSADAPAV